jgi:hypothetical protein
VGVIAEPVTVARELTRLIAAIVVALMEEPSHA